MPYRVPALQVLILGSSLIGSAYIYRYYGKKADQELDEMYIRYDEEPKRKYMNVKKSPTTSQL